MSIEINSPRSARLSCSKTSVFTSMSSCAAVPWKSSVASAADLNSDGFLRVPAAVQTAKAFALPPCFFTSLTQRSNFAGLILRTRVILYPQPVDFPESQHPQRAVQSFPRSDLQLPMLLTVDQAENSG